MKAFTSAPTFLPTSLPTAGWHRKRFLAPCWPCCAARSGRGDAHGQRHRLRPDRRHFFAQPGASRPRSPRIVGRQPVSQPRHHRRAGQPPAIRRLQLSGIGTKAGGHDYLLQFVIPRTITENTMRRGFAPTSEATGARDLSKERLHTERQNIPPGFSSLNWRANGFAWSSLPIRSCKARSAADGQLLAVDMDGDVAISSHIVLGKVADRRGDVLDVVAGSI